MSVELSGALLLFLVPLPLLWLAARHRRDPGLACGRVMSTETLA